jgi:hypothetical protein
MMDLLNAISICSSLTAAGLSSGSSSPQDEKKNGAERTKAMQHMK